MRDDRRHDGEMEMILASIRDQSVILQKNWIYSNSALLNRQARCTFRCCVCGLNCWNAGVLIDLIPSQSYRESYKEVIKSIRPHCAGWHDSLNRRHCYISHNTRLDPR